MAASSAVPGLIRLLGSSSEGDRNTACIALGGIGPVAKEALPALNRTLSDPIATVRSFAKRAIDRIEQTAHEKLVAFRDPSYRKWGYKRPDGRVAIPPRYLGAGVFHEGRAPVKDGGGFAIIDDTGRVVERIGTDSVTASAVPIPPPADACAWSAGAPIPSPGLHCYVRQLHRGFAAAIGGIITITPSGGESSHAALILRFPTGVVVVEDIRYEGFTRRVLLPGVSHDEALQWRLKLYPELPAKDGCSESWNAGALPGGAFIEQVGGC